MMYVENFWRYFEETGSVNMYLSMKEYEDLYFKHTSSSQLENNEIQGVTEIDKAE